MQNLKTIDSTPIPFTFSLEEIKADAGRFFICPESHKIDLGKQNSNNNIVDNHNAYIQEVVSIIKSKKMPIKAPYLNVGDILFWNSRTIHGSLDSQSKNFSRSSITIHAIPHNHKLLQFHSRKIDLKTDDLTNSLIHRPKDSKKIIKNLETFRKKTINDSEKYLLKKFINNFSKKEFLSRKKHEDKLAIYEAIYKPSKILHNVLEKNKNKKILLVGTNDHTYALVKTHKKEFKKKDVDYFELPFNDFLKSKNKIELLNPIRNLGKNYDVIIVSSFEYVGKIKKIINTYYDNSQIFSIYDNCSRSIMDTYLINRSKNKNNIYKNGIHQKL